MEFLIPEPEFEPQMAYVVRVIQDFAFVGTHLEQVKICLLSGDILLACHRTGREV